MDLSTTYMGLKLANPFVPGAGPLTNNLAAVRRLEDAGAGAVVMNSLFEEQITREQIALHHHTTAHEYSSAEALSYFPEPEEFRLGPYEYLERVAQLKEAVSIPIIASLNGVTMGGWVEYARRLQEAGADGLELNIYYVATDPDETSAQVEQRYFDILTAVKGEIGIPIAMKLSAFFSSPVNMARRLDEAGADALVIYNRFYQPDINVEELEAVPALRLSTSGTLQMRLRWLAAIFGRVRASLAATGGIHTGEDAVKAIMAGADAVQMTSALLQHGVTHLARIRSELTNWMEEHEYESVNQMRGSMSLLRCPDPSAFERANYMRILQSWQIGTSV